jgi:hypothetical protein
MHSRAARLMLFCLFVAAVSVAGFLFWQGTARMQGESARAGALDVAARTAERNLLDVRAGQFAYVAAGQGTDFWTTRVAHDLEAARSAIKTLRGAIESPHARAALDATESTIEDVRRVDKRAIEYVRTGQRLLASDVVFADGLELSEAALTSLEQARTLELESRAGAIETFRRRQLFALTAGAAASVLTVLLLVPAAPKTTPAQERPAPSIVETPARSVESSPQPARVPLDGDNWSGARTATPMAESIPLSVPATAEVVDVPLAHVATAPPEAADGVHADRSINAVVTVVSTTDLAGLASLCVDLARVSDTRALPDLLDRAATLLDASGIILWIADPDGRELNPIFAQGYPQQLVNRLGTIPREAENATAAAFRTSLLQTVNADEISGGAIAAPLITPNGCVGVMAAEVRHEAERQQVTLAAATIVAAQLATLVGPPSARPNAKSGSAGA